MRETVGYRGSFTVDGVVTDEGFLPTELNPRYGGAVGRMAHSLTDLPIYLLHLASAQGCDLVYRADDLEKLIVQAVCAAPNARAMHILKGRFDLESRKGDFLYEQGSLRAVELGAYHTVEVTLGSGMVGAVVFVSLIGEALEGGRSRAADLCDILQQLGSLWDLGIGPLAAAPDLQRPLSV